ncbi:uncharacterized protein LOC132631326 [Lycium barbarum]|uniref:uncharacterized protein LOC132631326 n=1 Tax=Lycium barbarum TaxID=112863 RepID=UPI00293EFAD7|nr:uncharacterized protein LOC132631326 [Lycium barbarum]
MYSLELHQMDVKTTFLNGELEKEIYMEQSEGFVVSGKEKKVLEKFKYLDFKVAKTPIDMNLALAKNKGDSHSQLDYARVLGSLMYIMNGILQLLKDTVIQIGSPVQLKLNPQVDTFLP